MGIKGRLTADRRATHYNTKNKKSKSMAISVFLPALLLLSIPASSPTKAGKHFLIETDDNAEAGPPPENSSDQGGISFSSSARVEKRECPEGKEWEEDCNLCRCHKEGIKVCTKRACVKIEEPGETGDKFFG